MSQHLIPFLIQVPRFVNAENNINRIKEKLVEVIPLFEEYLSIKMDIHIMVSKSFVSHLARLIERIYEENIIQGEQEYLQPEIESVFKQHHKKIKEIIKAVFPKVQITPIEVYFISLYFVRFEREI